MRKDEALFFPGLFFTISVDLLENFGHQTKWYKVVSSTTESCNGCVMQTAAMQSVNACQAQQNSSSRLGCWWGYQEMCYRECSWFWDGNFHLLPGRAADKSQHAPFFPLQYLKTWMYNICTKIPSCHWGQCL